MRDHVIPLARPSFDEREVEAVRRVLASGWVVQGPEVEAFEQAVAELHGARHGIAVSSGTAALHVGYHAMGLGPGDVVFVPGFAWPSAAHMACAVGASPVFVDVLPNTYNMDPADLRGRVEQCLDEQWGRPRAVVPVHSFGLAAEMTEILRIAADYGLEVVEDAACALGASYQGSPVGTLGRFGIFSFHPRKSVTTGEGGVIVTNDVEFAAHCRTWRNHGQMEIDGRRDFVVPGLNYRMTEIHAAIGRVQLTKLPESLARRQEIADVYLQQLDDCQGLLLPAANSEHTWQTFMVVVETEGIERATIINRMAKAGFEAGQGALAGHSARVYAKLPGRGPDVCPQSAKLDQKGLALPLHCFVAEQDGIECAVALRKLCDQQTALEN